MSRKTLLTRGVILAYAALFTQIFYSLASIPLALSFLSKAEFGLWGLGVTLMGYLNLMELGMTNAFQRHLMECRDEKEDGRYGRLFVASVLSLIVAALFVLLAGVLLVWLAAPFFKIPPELLEVFYWVMSGKVLLCSLSLATRMVGAPLYVYQRHDLLQFSQTCLYFILFLTLYLGLQIGWGLYAMLASAAAGVVWGLAFSFICCSKLGYYPPKGTYKLPDRAEWVSVLSYSRDLFFLQLGNQLANGMPMLLLPRLLGLEAVAMWTVCTRPFSILKQVVSKPYQISVPMLCEIYVKGETQRVARRWSHFTQLVLGISVCVFAVGAANNTTFIHLWVGEHIAWPVYLDWLVALYFISTLMVGAVFGLVGLHKHFGKIRLVPYGEAALITVNTLWMTHLWGFAGLLIAATISQIPGRIWFGLRYLANITKTPTSWLFRESMLRPLLVLPPSAFAAWFCTGLTGLLPGYAGLMLSAASGTLTSGCLVLFLGVSREVRAELLQMLMKPLRRGRKVKSES